jgi:hypothetical protein
LPWRPRIIIPGTATLRFSSTLSAITSIKEVWEVSLVNIFFEQMALRLWDAWNSFSSPMPEYPPVMSLGQAGGIQIFTLPETLACEATWTAANGLTGPTLLAVPDFSLFGEMQALGKELFCCALPVEVQAARYQDPISAEQRKLSKWIFHVPTALQSKVLDAVRLGGITLQQEDSLLDGAEITADTSTLTDADVEVETDYVTPSFIPQPGKLMSGLTGGVWRGNFTINETFIREYEQSQRMHTQYTHLPRRTIAAVDLTGEVSIEKINQALNKVKTVLDSGRMKVNGKLYRQKQDISRSNMYSQYNTQFGLQLFGTKLGFNNKGQPGIAIYEIQYGFRRTRLFLEIEEVI